MTHEKLPSCSLRTLLTRYLDITTPPSPNLLRFFATLATDQQDKDKLTSLSSVCGSFIILTRTASGPCVSYIVIEYS